MDVAVNNEFANTRKLKKTFSKLYSFYPKSLHSQRIKHFSINPPLILLAPPKTGEIFMETSLCRKERETQWVKTEDQLNENSIVVKGLDPGQVRFIKITEIMTNMLKKTDGQGYQTWLGWI